MFDQGREQIRYKVLGPFRAWRSAREIELGWAKQQAVLVVLLLEMNRSVPMHSIIDAVWGEHLPGDARSAVHTYISRLRRTLGIGDSPTDAGPSLVWTEAGYTLHGDPALLDLTVFEQRLARASACQERADLVEAANHINAALALWRGEPFSGLTGPGIEAERRRLYEYRVAALEQRAAINVEVGRHNELIAELTLLVNTYPTHERLRALLMLALYRSGRQTDALDLFQQTRQWLADEFGVEPGPELREAYQRILRGDTDPTGSGGGTRNGGDAAPRRRGAPTRRLP